MKREAAAGLVGDQTALLALEAAAQAGVRPALFVALVWRESGGNAGATRFEPLYPFLWDVKLRSRFRGLTDAEIRSSSAPLGFPSFPGCSRATEWTAQRTSWGPAQVMGSTARQLGYLDPFLSSLARDTAGALLLGARLLKILLVRYRNDEEDAVSSYNAGRPVDSNQEYVRAILEGAVRLEKE